MENDAGSVKTTPAKTEQRPNRTPRPTPQSAPVNRWQRLRGFMNTKPLTDRTVDELSEAARKAGIPVDDGTSQDELIRRLHEFTRE
jgi:hypothetical protein